MIVKWCDFCGVAVETPTEGYDYRGERLPLHSTVAIAPDYEHETDVIADVLCRPHRLYVPRLVSPHFIVIGFRVGLLAQMVPGIEVPAALFSAHLRQAPFDVAPPGWAIAVRVRNIDSVPRFFHATVYADLPPSS